MKTNILILFLFLSSCTVAQTYSSAVTDQEIYTFLNWLTIHSPKPSKDSISEPRMVLEGITRWDSSNIYLPNGSGDSKVKYRFQYIFKTDVCVDFLFQSSDISYFQHQFQSIKDSIWHKSMNQSWIIHQNERSTYFTYSIPFFTADRKFVIVKVDFHNHLFGSGGFDIYQKIGKDSWKFICRLYPWII